MMHRQLSLDFVLEKYKFANFDAWLQEDDLFLESEFLQHFTLLEKVSSAINAFEIDIELGTSWEDK